MAPKSDAYLKVINPDRVESRIVLEKKRATIGRASNNDIVLDDPCLSRGHARIDSTAKGVFLSDLGSRNGTWLNDVPVRTRNKLKDGDTIRLGNSLLIFKYPKVFDARFVLSEAVEAERLPTSRPVRTRPARIRAPRSE